MKKCGTESDSKFCPDCGTEMIEKVEPVTSKTVAEIEPIGNEKKSKKKIGCLIIVIVVILIAIVSCFGSEDEDTGDANETKATTATTQATTNTQQAKETTEAKKETKAKFNPNDYKNIPYKDLARNPDDYTYELVTNSGRVAQVIEGDGSTQLRVAIDDDYDKMVFLEYDSSITKSRVLEDDYITYYGVSAGLISYQSTMGGTISVPGIYVTKIKIK